VATSDAVVMADPQNVASLVLYRPELQREVGMILVVVAHMTIDPVVTAVEATEDTTLEGVAEVIWNR